MGKNLSSHFNLLFEIFILEEKSSLIINFLRITKPSFSYIYAKP